MKKRGMPTPNEKTPEEILAMLTPEQLAWLTAMFQAEGNISKDKRVRSVSTDPSYTPPPPAPFMKIEMVEEDVMDTIGAMVDEPVNVQERRTKGGKLVYRVSIYSRAKVLVFAKAMLTHVVGAKTTSELQEAIDLCEEHLKWVADGGLSKQAKLAAKARQAKAKKQK